MKIQAQPLFTIQVNNSVGRCVLWSIFLIIRCSVISLFIWVVAFNEGRAFIGEKYLTQAAKVLLYPVYQIEKPLFAFSGKFDCLYVVPERLGLTPFRIPQIKPVDLREPWQPDGIYVNETPFFSRAFNCNLTFITSCYFCFFAILKWIYSRLRPNP